MMMMMIMIELITDTNLTGQVGVDDLDLLRLG